MFLKFCLFKKNSKLHLKKKLNAGVLIRLLTLTLFPRSIWQKDQKHSSIVIAINYGWLLVFHAEVWWLMLLGIYWTVTNLLSSTCCSVNISTRKWTQNNTAWFYLKHGVDMCYKPWEKSFKVLILFWIFALQFVRNEVDHHGRSSRSPVMLFDIQENNNVNSFAVS